MNHPYHWQCNASVRDEIPSIVKYGLMDSDNLVTSSLQQREEIIFFSNIKQIKCGDTDKYKCQVPAKV